MGFGTWVGTWVGHGDRFGVPQIFSSWAGQVEVGTRGQVSCPSENRLGLDNAVADGT